MALLPDQKFSTFAVGGDLTTGDIIVGLRGGINTKFTWNPIIGVDTVTGTQYQVLVNNSFATPVTGDIVLTLPQNIAPTSSPTFAGLTLTSPLLGASGGTGIDNTGLTIDLGSGATGLILTSDSSGNATWQSSSSSGAITTIDGDSGSITPLLGAVTFTGNTTGLTFSGSGNTMTLDGTLIPANGGLGSSSTPSNGQIPIGNGTQYVAASITAGSGITITPGSGSLTISSSVSPGGLSWQGISGTNQLAEDDTAYVVQNDATTTITLPATAALGVVVAVQGLGLGGWILTANSGQKIQVGSLVTSTGGTVTSADRFDCIEVVCIGADIGWAMRFSVTSGFTVA